MAHVSTSAPVNHNLFHGIVEAARAVGRTLSTISETNEKIRQVEFLMSMSDEDLGKRGLERGDIVHHVFGGSDI